MKTTRSIAVYDNESEELVTKFNIDELSFLELKSIFRPAKKDPLMYDDYEIKDEHTEYFRARMDIEFDFKSYSYYVECRQKK